MARLKKRWNQRERSRTPAQMANAVAAGIWKLAAEVVLNLENENFETDTQAQRADLLEEVACYLVHYCDRWIYPRADESQRREFITCLAGDLARLIEDSRVDVQGDAEYRSAFVDRLNTRAADYASYSFDDIEGCSFAMRCRFGELVQSSLGERDRRWIPDYIVGREAPACETALRATLSALVDFDTAPD